MSGQELAPAGLAKRINEEHAACERAARTAIEHAFRAGAFLAEAKAGIPHGEWLPWVREHLSCSPRTAQGYMRLADNRERLTNAQRASHLSVRAALHLLAEPKDAEPEPLQDAQGRALIAAIDIGERIREELGDIEGLAKSIESVGLLEPIAVTPRGVLIVGRRRLEACRLLGWERIDVHVVDLPESDIGRAQISATTSRKGYTLAERVESHAATQDARFIPSEGRSLVGSRDGETVIVEPSDVEGFYHVVHYDWNASTQTGSKKPIRAQAVERFIAGSLFKGGPDDLEWSEEEADPDCRKFNRWMFASYEHYLEEVLGIEAAGVRGE